ncbi:DUF4349 domain-containing protein [Niabella insulamsoli]|uniref:DUF4349 domain-containing protein n=1 Tax=Niabella insulamsoli TaxID=3144874 RepID=UPI0031FC97E6
MKIYIRKGLFFAMIVLPCLLQACSSLQNKEVAPHEISANEVMPQQAENQAPAGDAAINAEPAPQYSGSDIAGAPVAIRVPAAVHKEKQIIKNANVSLEVKKHGPYTSFIRNLVKRYGGYISKEYSSTNDYRIQTVMALKVPVLQFETLLNELESKDAKQLEREITSEDVTRDVIDMQARLETRKATRQKYMELLKQSSKVEDILKVQQQINDIQEDIESATAQLAQLSGAARYSTINLTFFEPLAGYNAETGRQGLGSRIVRAFSDGGKLFTDLCIGLLTIWPVWIGVLVFLFILKRFRRSRAVVKRNV